MTEFDWDEAKNRSNHAKHGVWFEEAKSVWSDTLALAVTDYETEEDRFLVFGLSTMHRLLVVSYTYRGNQVRIISARKLTAKERRYYER